MVVDVILMSNKADKLDAHVQTITMDHNANSVIDMLRSTIEFIYDIRLLLISQWTKIMLIE
jgi:hypothetical protein